MNKTLTIIIQFGDQSVNQPDFLDCWLVKNSAKRAYSKALNQTIKKAFRKGYQQVLLLNPDTQVKKGFLKPLEKVLAKKDIGICGPIIKHKQGFDHGGWINWWLGRTNHYNYPKVKIKKPAEREFVSGACMLIKKEVFDQINYFDEQFFLYFEDVDFCLRAKKAGFKTMIAPRSMIKHVTGPNEVKSWRKIKLLLTSNLRFIKKWQPGYFQPLGLMYLLVLSVKMVWGRINHD